MKLKRYHIDIYCPDWARGSILVFNFLLKDIKLQYSYHANIKLSKMKSKYRTVIKELIKNLDVSDELYMDYIFEFYANNDRVVKKICYRFPIADLDNDIILVISSSGKVVTIYLNDNFDKHHSLDESKYEKGDIINESKVITTDINVV